MVVVGVRGGERRPLISLSFLDTQTIVTASNYSQYPVTILNFVENQIWMIRFLVHFSSLQSGITLSFCLFIVVCPNLWSVSLFVCLLSCLNIRHALV